MWKQNLPPSIYETYPELPRHRVLPPPMFFLLSLVKSLIIFLLLFSSPFFTIQNMPSIQNAIQFPQVVEGKGPNLDLLGYLSALGYCRRNGTCFKRRWWLSQIYS